jgi:hypothetical protein
MRTVRSFVVWLAVAAITAACASAPPGAGSEPPAGSEPGVASQATGVSQQPAASEPAASAAIGANGSIKYQITGEYTGSGELPFWPTYGDYSSYFTPGAGAGWYALFKDAAAPDDHYISLNTGTPGEELFFHQTPIVVALSGGVLSPDECTFSSTKNDETGLIGSVVCTSAELYQADGQPVLNVTFSAQWDAHP